MTGFHKGPSLFTHVFVLAILEAVLVPLVHDYSGNWGITALAGLGFLVVYIAAALYAAFR